MMRDSKSGGEKSIKEVQKLRARKPKLERVSSDIAEHKTAEEELRQSEEFLANMIDALDDPVFVKDEQHRWVVLNDAACKVMGRSREELIGKSDYDLFPKEQADVFWGRDDSVLRRGKTDVNEEEITWHGKLHTISTKKSLFTDSVTGKKFVVGTIRDITERKHAEQALRESEQKLRLLFEGAYDLISLANADAKTLWANPAWMKIFGAESEYKADPFSSIHPDDRERVAESWQDLISGAANIKNLEYRYKVPKGQYLTFESCAYPVIIDQQRLYYVVARDVTERKRAEQALRESEETARAILNATYDLAFLINTEGTMLALNETFAKRFGKRVDELIGSCIYDLLPPDVAARRKAQGDNVIRSGQPLRFEDIRQGRYLDSSVYPVFNADGRVERLAVYSSDITERKNAEKRLLREQAKLKSLASQLSLAEEHERRRIATELHDRIGQSLVISKMNLETLRKSGQDEQSARTLDEVCNLLGRAITDTRTLTFDLSSPILYQLGFETAVAEWLTEQIQDNHGIATQFEDDGRPKPLDDDISVLLFRNVRELLINVVKHAHAHKVKVAIRRVGKKIQVSVEDDGAGFEPAETTSTATKRAEFGLFSIRQRLEQLGGHLEIKSEPGRGCKVTMTAPLKKRID